MEQNFEQITSTYEDSPYIIISTDELTLKVLPFYSLPARKIADLFSKQKNQQKFIKTAYNLIHLSMENPNSFKDLVYDTGLTYTGIIKFINTWIQVSRMINRFETGNIDNDGNKTPKDIITNVDVIETMIYSKLSKGEEIKPKMLIRYLSEHIRQTAVQYNKDNPEDVIYEINITIPVGEELNDEY